MEYSLKNIYYLQKSNKVNHKNLSNQLLKAEEGIHNLFLMMMISRECLLNQKK